MQIILKAWQLQKGFNKIKHNQDYYKDITFRGTTHHNYKQAVVKWLQQSSADTKKRSDEVLRTDVPFPWKDLVQTLSHIQLPRNAESLQLGEAINYSTRQSQYSVREERLLHIFRENRSATWLKRPHHKHVPNANTRKICSLERTDLAHTHHLFLWKY